MRRIAGLSMLALIACGGSPPAPAPAPAVTPVAATPPETVTVVRADPEVERQLAEVQLRLLEKDAQIEKLRELLDEAQREVVRALAKLQSSATRAEAASAMAEAELVLQSLRRGGGAGTDADRAAELMTRSAAEFNSQNYGGALYWANHVKTAVGQRGLALGGEPMRPGETAFAVTVQMVTSTRANVREGPGTDFRILFTLDKGAALTGHSHFGRWIRVQDGDGRMGWIHQGLVTR